MNLDGIQVAILLGIIFIPMMMLAENKINKLKKDIICLKCQQCKVKNDINVQLEQINFELPDNYSESKDWMSSNTLNRILWLKSMFESKKAEIVQLEKEIELRDSIIKKLRCCANCKYSTMTVDFVDCNNLFVQQKDITTSVGSNGAQDYCSKWELREDKQ